MRSNQLDLLIGIRKRIWPLDAPTGEITSKRCSNGNLHNHIQDFPSPTCTACHTRVVCTADNNNTLPEWNLQPLNPSDCFHHQNHGGCVNVLSGEKHTCTSLLVDRRDDSLLLAAVWTGGNPEDFCCLGIIWAAVCCQDPEPHDDKAERPALRGGQTYSWRSKVGDVNRSTPRVPPNGSASH